MVQEGFLRDLHIRGQHSRGILHLAANGVDHLPNIFSGWNSFEDLLNPIHHQILQQLGRFDNFSDMEEIPQPLQGFLDTHLKKQPIPPNQ